MIVDVMDLNFESLNFNESYDNARYRRGSNLYDSGWARVNTVIKENDKKYLVKGTVRSNNDSYNTILKIDNGVIIHSSCTCPDYNNGYLCKHIIALAKETIEPHFPSTEEGIKRQQKKWEEERRKREEEAKKRREYLCKYQTGLNAIEKYNYANIRSTEPQNTININELYDKVQEEKKEKNGNLATNIKLEYTVDIESRYNLSLVFKIGTTRMYSIGSLCDFYKAYKNSSEINYGKQLRLIPKRENFEEKSRELFDFVIKYAELIEYHAEHTSYGLTSNATKKISLSGVELDSFFENHIGETITLQPKHYTFPNYEITNEKLEIFCTLTKEKIKPEDFAVSYYYEPSMKESEEYVLKINPEEYMYLITDKKVYLFSNHKIYPIDNTKNLRDMLDMFDLNNKIIIPEDRLEEFKKKVFPHIRNLKIENLPEEQSTQTLVVDKLASKILLDVDDNGDVLLELRFCYQNYEYNILEKNYEKYIQENNIVRDVPAEKEVLKRIFMDGFEPDATKKKFVMKNDEDMYEFLRQRIEGYMNDFEVLATDKFKNKQIKQPKISNIGIRINNGLLELDISKMNIDISEIKDVLKDYNIKKRYHKLKNGDLLDLTKNESLDILDEMSTTLDIDYSKIKDGVVDLPMSRSFYLENLANSNKDINISKNEQFAELIDDIENSEITDEIKIDKDIEEKLRDYQKVGYKWLRTLERYHFGGILADDMGLGKTLQIISVLKTEIENNKKSTSIVVCPSTLVLNWKAEIEKWCPMIKVLIIRGTADERKNQIEDCKKYNLVITSYDLLKRDVENYKGKKFKYIIADEAQYIKNSSTQNATSLKSLNGDTKFALTGTPIENSIAELWSIFDFIMPGYLYNYNKFKKKFEEPILKLEDTEALVRLKKLISPFVLRRVKKDVLTELPEKNITIMKSEMSKEQEKIYLSYWAQTKKEVAEELSGNGFEKSKFKILMLLTRLRQICCHPSLFIENYNGGSGKLDQCMDLVNDAIEAGHKILIFSSYTSMFEIIEKGFEKSGIKYFKLMGSTPVGKRIEMVDEFNKNADVKVFLISLKAGGTGLNLTSADVVIHYDPWWNVSSENQATDRAYRIGQKNSVQVYKLIASNSIEEKINKMQERKEKLSKDVLSTEETFINKMSKEEILNLFE